MSAKNVKKKSTTYLIRLHWQNYRIFCWLTIWLSGKWGNKPSRKTSFCHVLHLQYGPLLSWLHQRRQTNNTYKCEICRYYNSIPVGVIVTGFKTELGRFRKETGCCCTCDSSRLDATIQEVLYFKVKKKMKALKSCKKRAEPRKEQQQKAASYTLANTRAPTLLLWLDCWSSQREAHDPAGPGQSLPRNVPFATENKKILQTRKEKMKKI